MFEIDAALRTLVEREGSDLHVKVAAPPTIRLHGELVALEGYEPLSDKDTEKAFHDIAEVRSLTEFEEAGETDFSYALPGVSRFRVNAFRQRGSISARSSTSARSARTPRASRGRPRRSTGSSTSSRPTSSTRRG